MTLTWKDGILIALIVGAVILILRPKAKKAGCGCSAKPLPPKSNATTAAPAARRCSGGIALCGGR